MLSDSSTSHTGTQIYMAPELLAGKPASTRSDIFALGVVLYQMVVGDLARPLSTDWAESITDPLLREDLKHCFAGNPTERFAGAGQLAKHIRALPERQASLARQQAEQEVRERAAYRRGLFRSAAVAGTVVAVMGALAWYARNQARQADRLARREAVQRQQAQESARELRRNVYVSDMDVAHEAYGEHNLWLALNLVRKHIPKPGDTEEDLRAFEWRYLWKLCRGDEFFTFTNHNHIVTCTVFSPDGRTLATASLDNTVKIFDVESRKLLASFTGPVDGGGQSPLRAVTSEQFARNALAFSLDGNELVAAGDFGLGVWNTHDWSQPPRRLASEGSTVSGFGQALPVTFSPDGQMLTAGGSKGLRFWDTATWQRKQMLEARGAQPVTALAYSPDGKTLATSNDQFIELWDVPSATQLPGSPIAFEYGAGVKFSDKVLAAGSYDGDVLLWDLVSHRVIKRWKPNKTLAFGLNLSPDGRVLATGGADQLIHLWDVATQQKLATLQGHLNEVWSVTFSPDGQKLASGDKDTTVKLWSTVRQSNENALTSSHLPLWFSADGHTLITSDPNLNLQIWELPAGHLVRTIDTHAEGHRGPMFGPSISPDGQRGALLTRQGTVQEWDLRDGHRTTSYALEDTNPARVIFSADGRFLAASGFQHGLAKVWDRTTGQEIARFPDTRRAIALSPDGRLFATSSGNEYAIKLWDLATKAEIATLHGHQWVVLQLAFSPDGKRLVSGAIDNTARIWDTASRRQLFVLQGHQSGVHTVAFSPDGRTVATGSTDETVKLWNVATGQQLLTLREFKEDLGMVLFSPDGTMLAAGTALTDSSRPVHIWRAPSFQEIELAERIKGPE
jgi:WD40 repeat protein